MARIRLEVARSIYARSLVLGLGERERGIRSDALEAARVIASGGSVIGPAEAAIRAREDVLCVSLFGGELTPDDYRQGRVPFTEALLSVRDCRALQMLLGHALPRGATYFTRPLPGEFGGRLVAGVRGDAEVARMVSEVRGRSR